MRWLINCLYFIGLLIGLPFFLFKMATAGKYRRGLMQRFGISLPTLADGKPVIWVHAVSVGELQLSRPLIAGLRERYPDHQIVVTHTTRTGEQVAEQLYPDLVRCYFPLDFSFAVARFFRAFRPELVVLVELELWPNFLLHAKRSDIPVVLVNGRIGERSASGYGRNAWFFRRPFSALSLAAMQNEEYAARLRRLFERMGLSTEVINVAGNIKFDNVRIGVDQALRSQYRGLFGFGEDELVLVCGSTHPGEHEILVDLYRRWREAGLPLRMVVAPRHPERYGSVREIWKRAGVGLIDRSCLTLPSSDSALRTPHSAPCILLDTMGELGKVYHCADIVFVGGSLIPHGGQNMAEPAGIGVPVLFGPHTFNFPSVVRELIAADACVQVKDSEELFANVRELAADPQRRARLSENAQRVVEAGKGAVERHLALIESEVQSPKSEVRSPESGVKEGLNP
ncbi:MAG: 3-deoxy-D-manno-octulosonic acid transferase [Planctomycetaceae bacterium]|nr:3-deoxy-D-manno-octulosonic acid transferase [Planctomycetaceae bacterium]